MEVEVAEEGAVVEAVEAAVGGGGGGVEAAYALFGPACSSSRTCAGEIGRDRPRSAEIGAGLEEARGSEGR